MTTTTLKKAESSQVANNCRYSTLASARADGYRTLRYYEYGGEQVTVKGKTLVRNPKQAQSMTWWEKEGFKVKFGQAPHATRAFMFSGRMVEYGIYRDDQVEPIPPQPVLPAPDVVPATKHGVHVREHKHWNTKTVYNNGYVMRIYRRQPKVIRFCSPMVNDFNQHLCGGWSFADIKDDREATVGQLLAGRKPFASITYWQDQLQKAVDAQHRLDRAGLVTNLRRREWHGCNSDHVWDLRACHDLHVREIGDLTALREDYTDIFEMGLETEEVMMFADRQLSSFFDGWDSPPLPLWLTGLILGYPVENTISLYLE